ncbi:DUF6300 family protein [Streptomyces sp. NPDC127038]|uniref:DUF6300 family protein n=1 Tax=Streptomyces sp. NPDC127038 TaxID=3347114 RepID=UPI00365F6C79
MVGSQHQGLTLYLAGTLGVFTCSVRSEVHRLEISDLLPPCSRCGKDLIISCIAPRDDTAGRPIHLQLCSACDGEKQAAGALLFWFASGGGHDMERSHEGARLLLEWTKEAMAEHGWYWRGNDLDAAAAVPGLEHDEAAARRLMNPGTTEASPEIEQMQWERDALRAEFPSAGPEQRAQLQLRIRELGAAIAEALTAADATAEALRATAPHPAPGPLSPEAERRLHDLFKRLEAEHNDLDDDC